MAVIEGFDFFPVHCDGDGKIQSSDELRALTSAVQQRQPSDVIFIAHGFRNDENDASGLYSGFLQTFGANLNRTEFAAVKARRFVVCGIFWPSKAFKESFDEGAVQNLDDRDAEKREVRRRLEELKATDACEEQRPKIEKALKLLDTVDGSTAAQDEFVTLVLSLLDDAELDATEGLQKVREQDGSRLLELLEKPLFLPTVPKVKDADDEGGALGGIAPVFDNGGEGGTQGIRSVFGSIFGRIGQFLNLTTWYLMKDRSGKVGAGAGAEAVRAVRAVAPAIKVHLVGHSLGGRLMASCAKALAEEGTHKVDSLTLLQAAFSHYGLSSTRKENTPGFFRAVIDKKVVRGPLIATYSAKDTVVGKAYAIMSRLANDNTRAVGDKNDEFGGIGRNGSQNAPGSIVEPLHQVGAPYAFSAGVIINLDGSQGLITNHGDVRSANVTYAFAWVVEGT
ncbi:MAG: hypothetical protein H0W08_11020 [Acidobacteria bacterium]|nr:hypothetical protein [Acidobacteriota bacterium]